MKWRTLGIAILLIGASALGASFVWRNTGRGATGATPLQEFTIQLQLEPQERLLGATAGDLTDSLQPALVFGTLMPDLRGQVRVLHFVQNRYEVAWMFSHETGGFDSAIVRDVNNSRRNDLVTLWRSGEGAYLDVRIFEWDGQTYQEIWKLPSLEGGGQLTQGATFSIRRVNEVGSVELVIRAPNVPPGASTLGPVSHQVSIYRWDTGKRTFSLFRRFVGPEKTFE